MTYSREAKRRVLALIEVLEPLVEFDPDWEMRGIGVPVLGAGFDAVRAAMPDDAVVAALVGPCMQLLRDGGAMRCADALLVANQLHAVVRHPTNTIGEWEPLGTSTEVQ